MRVIHVVTGDMAVRFLLLRQLLDLKERGYRVSVVCSDGPWLNEVRKAGVSVKVIPIHRTVTPLADVLSLWRLYRYLRRERPSIVQTHTPKANMLAQLAAWLACVPIRIKTARGFYFDERWSRWKKVFYGRVERVSSWCAHCVFVQSHADLAMAVREKFSPESKLRYLGNGIDLKPFHRQDCREAAARLRGELGFAREAPVVGIVGRLTREKGYAEFIEAAGEVHRKRSEVRFVAVGPEDVWVEADIIRLTRLHNLEGSFRWVGMRLDMAGFYAMMDVLVLPSYREGVPRVLMEAAAMSLAAIATDLRGCREVIDSGETGLLVPVGDSPALARAILWLLSDGERRVAMGTKARLKALREFDEKSVFDRLRSTYSECLQNRRQ